VIKEDAGGRENPIGFAVIDRHPMRVKFGGAIGTARIKRRRFVLRKRLRGPEHFRSRGLIETNARINRSDGLKHAHGSNTGYVGRGDWLIERDMYEALRGEVVNFVRFRCLDKPQGGT